MTTGRAIAIGAILLSGCAQTIAVHRTAAVPAATAKAELQVDDNHNAQITLEVAHLAAASNLTPAKALYVVWAQTREMRSFALGRLKLDKDGEGTFVGTVPVHEFRILVTAEDSAAADKPSEQVVLQTDFVAAAK
jgi:hypothetical protein